MKPAYLRGVLGVVLVALVCMAFGHVVTHDFSIWDDPDTLWRNKMFNPPTWAKILPVWVPTNPQGALYIPVTYTFWGLLSEIAWNEKTRPFGIQLNPTVFKVGSLALHCVTSLVVMALITRLLRVRGIAGAGAAWCAFLGAAAYATHPFHAEAVGWTSGQKDLLWGLFSVTAVYCYLRAAEAAIGRSPQQPKIMGSRWWWLGLVCFVGGMLCKPTAMVTPVLAGLVHLLALGRGPKEVARGLWVWGLFIPLAILWTKLNQPGSAVPSLPLAYRPMIVADALAFYLGKLALPFNMAFDYGRNPFWARENGWLYWTWIFPLAAGVLVWRVRRSHPLVALGAAWFVVAVSPVLGLFPFLFQYYSTVADHYMYGSMVGVGIAFAWGTWVLAGRIGMGRAVIVAALPLTMFVLRSSEQIKTWRDLHSVNEHNLTINPRSFASLTNLGALISMESEVTGDYSRLPEALDLFDRAVAINEHWQRGWDNRGVVLLMMGRTAEATESIERAILSAVRVPPQIRGPMGPAYQMFGAVKLRRGEYTEAIKYFELAERERDAWGGLVWAGMDRLPAMLADARMRLANPDLPPPTTFPSALPATNPTR
jgi:protein O-mannosyl-transferase